MRICLRRAAHISANGYANGSRYGDEYGYGSRVCIYTGLRPLRDQVNQQVLDEYKVTTVEFMDRLPDLRLMGFSWADGEYDLTMMMFVLDPTGDAS